MCEYCQESGKRKNLFLTHEAFAHFPDTSEALICDNNRIEIASEDYYSLYEKPTRSCRRIEIQYCPICGRKL